MKEKENALGIFKSFLNIFYEFFKAGFFILLIFFILRYFLVQPFLIDGNSMEPNFHDKEYLLVEKVSHYFGKPERGDVIIFHPPDNPSSFYIKRIVGLPGEKVTIEKNKVFIYNNSHLSGTELVEPYLDPNEKTAKDTVITLQVDQYFVLGDNRDNSSDSREFGAIPRENITGRAFWIVLPFSKFGLVKRFQYPSLGFNLNLLI